MLFPAEGPHIFPVIEIELEHSLLLFGVIHRGVETDSDWRVEMGLLVLLRSQSLMAPSLIALSV